MVGLAVPFLEGRGVARSRASGLALLRQAIAWGDAGAMRELGSRYLDGFGVGLHEVAGVALYRQAIEAGDA
jgi:TPR repeat protein